VCCGGYRRHMKVVSVEREVCYASHDATRAGNVARIAKLFRTIRPPLAPQSRRRERRYITRLLQFCHSSLLRPVRRDGLTGTPLEESKICASARVGVARPASRATVKSHRRAATAENLYTQVIAANNPTMRRRKWLSAGARNRGRPTTAQPAKRETGSPSPRGRVASICDRSERSH
jgi:hypothetical protein